MTQQLFNSYAEANAARQPGSEFKTCHIHGKWANLPPLDSRILESSGLGRPKVVYHSQMQSIWKAWRYGQQAMLKRPGCGITARFNELYSVNLGYHVIAHNTTDNDPQLSALVKLRERLSFVDVNDAQAIAQYLTQWHYGTSLYDPKFEPWGENDLLYEVAIEGRGHYLLSLCRIEINQNVWGATLLYPLDHI